MFDKRETLKEEAVTHASFFLKWKTTERKAALANCSLNSNSTLKKKKREENDSYNKERSLCEGKARQEDPEKTLMRSQKNRKRCKKKKAKRHRRNYSRGNTEAILLCSRYCSKVNENKTLIAVVRVRKKKKGRREKTNVASAEKTNDRGSCSRSTTDLLRRRLPNLPSLPRSVV